MQDSDSRSEQSETAICVLLPAVLMLSSACVRRPVHILAILGLLPYTTGQTNSAVKAPMAWTQPFESILYNDICAAVQRPFVVGISAEQQLS